MSLRLHGSVFVHDKNAEEKSRAIRSQEKIRRLKCQLSYMREEKCCYCRMVLYLRRIDSVVRKFT